MKNIGNRTLKTPTNINRGGMIFLNRLNPFLVLYLTLSTEKNAITLMPLQDI